jgi:hypothetical protein
VLIGRATNSVIKRGILRRLPHQTETASSGSSSVVLEPVAEPREFPHKVLSRLTGFSDTEFGERLEKLQDLEIAKFDATKRVTADNAYVLAALSALVYESPQDQVRFLESQPAVRTFTFLDSSDNSELGHQAPDTGTQLSLYEMDDAVIVSARGTVFATDGPGFFDREWEDFLNNINTYPVDNDDGSAKVHEGFKDAADGIWEQLKPHLSKAIGEGKKLHFTGHSLGGSVATHLCSRTHSELDTPIQSLTTFGGPATGWGGQKSYLERTGVADASLRFTTSGDPTVWAVPGGRHAGQEAYFNRAGQLAPGEGWNLKDRICSITWDNISDGRHPIAHHHSLNYCSLIDQNREMLDHWPEEAILLA